MDYPKFHPYIACQLFILSVPAIYLPTAYFIGIETLLVFQLLNNSIKKILDFYKIEKLKKRYDFDLPTLTEDYHNKFRNKN